MKLTEAVAHLKQARADHPNEHVVVSGKHVDELLDFFGRLIAVRMRTKEPTQEIPRETFKLAEDALPVGETIPDAVISSDIPEAVILDDELEDSEANHAFRCMIDAALHEAAVEKGTAKPKPAAPFTPRPKSPPKK
jgi:hypothetical protein